MMLAMPFSNFNLVRVELIFSCNLSNRFLMLKPVSDRADGRTIIEAITRLELFEGFN